MPIPISSDTFPFMLSDISQTSSSGLWPHSYISSEINLPKPSKSLSMFSVQIRNKGSHICNSVAMLISTTTTDLRDNGWWDIYLLTEKRCMAELRLSLSSGWSSLDLEVGQPWCGCGEICSPLLLLYRFSSMPHFGHRCRDPTRWQTVQVESNLEEGDGWGSDGQTRGARSGSLARTRRPCR